MPDSSVFHGHFQVNTLGHLSQENPNLNIPHLEKMGIHHLTYMKEANTAIGRYSQRATPINISKPIKKNLALFAKSRSASVSNDSLSVLWELAGLSCARIHKNFCDGLPEELVEKLIEKSSFRFFENSCAGIDQVLKNHGDDHVTKGMPIVFTTGNSDLILTFHKNKITMDEIYQQAKKFLNITMEGFNLSHLRLLPFHGESGGYIVAFNEETSLMQVPEGVSLFSILSENNIPVVGNEKIARFFDFVGFEEILQNGDMDFAFQELNHVLHNSNTDEHGRVLVVQSIDDLNDFAIPNKNINDYIETLEKFDEHLGELLRNLRSDDLLIVTSLNGGDVTSQTKGVSREYLPIFFYSRSLKETGNLGIFSSMRSIAQTISELYDLGFSFNVPHYPLVDYL